MSLRSSFFLPLVSLFSLISLIAACGGSIDSPKSDPTIEGEGNTPGGNAGEAKGGGVKAVGGGGGGSNCTAAPACDPGDQRVSGSSGCLQDDARCYQRELCGATIWCTGTLAQCAGYPSCKPGYVEVKSCATKDCVAETVCGATIYCMPDAQCDGYPSCDAGHTKIASPAQCLQDDAVCYSRSLCGATIWCTGPITPPPPPGNAP